MKGTARKAIMKRLFELAARALGPEEGQALAEYGLLLAFIAAVCVLALVALGVAIAGSYTSIIGSF